MRLGLAWGLVVAFGLALGAPGCGADEGTGHHAGGEGGEAGEAGTGGAGGAGGGDEKGGEGPGAGAGGEPSRCRALTLGRPGFYFNTLGQLTGLKYPVRTEIGDAKLPEYLLIELYDSTTETGNGFLPPLATGDFDLTRAPDGELATCQHCVSLLTDVTEASDPLLGPIFQPAGWYFQQSGRLHLEEVHDPLNESLENSAFAGSVRGVELGEIDLKDPAQPFVPGGQCYYVAEAEFDKRPTPGEGCEDLEDCGNEVLEICDPTTLSCVDESQCNIDQPCPGSAFCIQQSPLSQLGACYPSCTPFAMGACPDGQTCVQYGISEKDGYCLKTGDAELGAKCEPKDATTGCQGDATCVGTCTAQCGYFSGAPSCPQGSSCDVLGHCLAPSSGDAAALGETCRENAALADGCARDGARFAGICFGYDPSKPLLCSRSCFVDANDYDGDAEDGSDDPDCAPEEFCALRFSSGLGVCLPDPVCGDGEFGEVGEVCDDHNNKSGDGCSADCQTVEYDVLCSAAPALAPDGNVESTTAGAIDGFKSSCQTGRSRGRVYTLTPPGPGQVKLVVTSDTQHMIALRQVCEDDAPANELGCGESLRVDDGSPSLLYQVTATDPQPVTVLVNAGTVLDEGPFTLTTEFTPQVCGDSLKVGSEACDDGNQVDNDGCSADCSTIEYDYWCDDAATLPLDKTVQGDVEGGPHLFTPSCGYGDGPDRLYRLTAPKSGTLTVTLGQDVEGTETDLSLMVLGSCGAPDPTAELGCSAVLSPAEEVSVEVTKNQTVFIGVDGLFAQAGKYELIATVR